VVTCFITVHVLEIKSCLLAEIQKLVNNVRRRTIETRDDDMTENRDIVLDRGKFS
jgi:hypothetical protein